MDFFEASDRDSFGGRGGGDERLVNAARAQTLRYSNFLLTISTNVRPRDEDEKDALVEWLLNTLGELFGDFDNMNGNVIKPPGTPNQDTVGFPDNHKLIKLSSRIAVEQGDFQKGQVHAHVLFEVAHMYVTQEHGAVGSGTDRPDRRQLGVHINVVALRNWLNNRIPEMALAPDRLPPKIYVNSRLLTKGTDNSNKFLTLQYLNKDRAKDNDGGVRDLRADERAADPLLRETRDVLLNGGPTIGHDPETNVIQRPQPRRGYGGALTPPDSPPEFRRTTRAPSPPQFRRTTTAPVAPTFQQTTQAAPKFVRTTRGQINPRNF